MRAKTIGFTGHNWGLCLKCGKYHNSGSRGKHPCPENAKNVLRLKAKERFETGKQKPFMLGKHHTAKTREMMKAKAADRFKNIIHKGKYPPLFFREEFKELIKERDDYRCLKCGISQSELRKKLSVHHIDYDKKNCNPWNLISLCPKCNAQVNFNGEYWISYFYGILENYYPELQDKDYDGLSKYWISMQEAMKMKKKIRHRKPHSEVTKMKLRLANLGKHQTEATLKKMSLGRMGEKNPNFGKHRSEKTKAKIRRTWKSKAALRVGIFLKELELERN